MPTDYYDTNSLQKLDLMTQLTLDSIWEEWVQESIKNHNNKDNTSNTIFYNDDTAPTVIQINN